MKEGFYDLLKGKFLISQDAFRNWKLIFFCALLAIIMIASSHSSESKVHEIARLHEDVRELRSEFVDGRSNLMRLKMESTLIQKMADRGIKPSDTPPTKIIITSNK